MRWNWFILASVTATAAASSLIPAHFPNILFIITHNWMMNERNERNDWEISIYARFPPTNSTESFHVNIYAHTLTFLTLLRSTGVCIISSLCHTITNFDTFDICVCARASMGMCLIPKSAFKRFEMMQIKTNTRIPCVPKQCDEYLNLYLIRFWHFWSACVIIIHFVPMHFRIPFIQANAWNLLRSFYSSFY